MAFGYRCHPGHSWMRRFAEELAATPDVRPPKLPAQSFINSGSVLEAGVLFLVSAFGAFGGQSPLERTKEKKRRKSILATNRKVASELPVRGNSSASSGSWLLVVSPLGPLAPVSPLPPTNPGAAWPFHLTAAS